ncbi:TPR Domain containing protein [Fusarium sp. NRRL 52700]|nr:TPR Domain containing protein [Fusarium sp. NRRL 52700]
MSSDDAEEISLATAKKLIPLIIKSIADAHDTKSLALVNSRSELDFELSMALLDLENDQGPPVHGRLPPSNVHCLLEVLEGLTRKNKDQHLMLSSVQLPQTATGLRAKAQAVSRLRTNGYAGASHEMAAGPEPDCQYEQEAAGIMVEKASPSRSDGYVSEDNMPTREVSEDIKKKRNAAKQFMEQAYTLYDKKIEPLTKIKALKDENRIRVAVLDTGVDKTERHFLGVRGKAGTCLKEIESFIGCDPHDIHGHGTRVAALIAEMAPHADLFIAQISNVRTIHGIHQYVKAIQWAIDRKVHIINISSSMEDDDDIRQIIEAAQHEGIIVIAAASDNTANTSRAFPGSVEKVLAIHSTDGWGRICEGNPERKKRDANFSTLGESIRSPLKDLKYQLTLYESGQHGAILQDAIGHTREAIDLKSNSPDITLSLKIMLALALYYNYNETGHADDIDEAVELSMQVVTITGPQDTAWVERMKTLVVFVKARSQIRGNIEDLNIPIDLLQHAMTDESVPLETRRSSAVMAMPLLDDKYASTRADNDFSLALRAYDIAMDLEPKEDTASESIVRQRSLITEIASTIFRKRFEVSKDPQDIDRSISLARGFVRDGDPSHDIRCAAALALALWTDFRVRGDMEKLEEAFELMTRVAQCQPLSEEDYLDSLANLSAICQTRYNATGNEADLNTCLHSALKALDVKAPDGSVMLRVGLLITASSAYQSKADRYGDLESIQIAVRYASEARDLAADKTLDMDVSASLDVTLSQALIRRYHHQQILADISEAVKTLQHAKIIASEHFQYPIVLNNLGEALRVQFSRTGDVACLTDAIDALEDALASTSANDPTKGLYGSNLSLCLYDLFEVTKEHEILERSIEASENAIRNTNVGSAHLPDRLNNNGVLYAARFELTNMSSDMDRAISQTQAAIDASAPHNLQSAMYYNNLGRHLMRGSLARQSKNKERCKRSEEDMTASLQAYKQVLYMVGANPLWRARAGYSAASIAFNTGDLEGAEKLVEKAVDLLPKISPLALDRSDQEYALSDISGLSCYATSIALEAGSGASKALRIQESGRGVIAGLIISARNDISDLEASAPEIAAEYKECRDLLTTATTLPFPASGIANHTVAHGVDRYELNKRLDALEDRIRREVPGFANFQRPLSTDELRKLADKGPVISFNVSNVRSDALVITSTDINCVSLPNLTEEDLRNNAKLFLEKPKITRGGLSTKYFRNTSLLGILKWLWDVAVHPVLYALGIHQSPPGEKLPRVWWTASGLMALMPIHAAGDHTSEGAPSMFNFVIPSYTTTLRALAYARETDWKPLRGADTELTFIASPNNARSNTLLTVEESARELSDTVRQYCKTKTVLGPTKSDTLGILESCSAVYFGCHGQSVSTQPCRSFLQLGTDDDSHLSIQEIQGSRLRKAQLAYLSACYTANVSARHLVDEIVHIAGAFSLLGFRQVVGTFWEAKNTAARVVAKRFYEELMIGDGEDEDCVVRAYYTAVMELRASNIRDPLVWATFAHFGA